MVLSIEDRLKGKLSYVEKNLNGILVHLATTTDIVMLEDCPYAVIPKQIFDEALRSIEMLHASLVRNDG